MRRGGLLLSAVCLTSLPACRDADGAGIEDPLILELGGDGPSLGEKLQRREVIEAREESSTQRPLRTLPEPDPRERVVRLPEGWTLSKLCEVELHDSSRWREIAALNGWTEEQCNRLSAGEKVRLPVE